MRLYAGMSVPFIQDTVRNQIARKLCDAFLNYYGYPPGKSEVASWGNSAGNGASGPIRKTR